jgi:ankyrin repeat protein
MHPMLLRFALGAVLSLGWMGCGPQAPTISLHQAVDRGNLKAVQQHIAAKSDLNPQDGSGWTPLHRAAVKGDLAIVQALTAAGADLKRPAKSGKTALDLAREKGHTAIVQFLREQKDQPPAEQAEKRGRGLIDGGLGVSEVLDAY